MRQGDKDVFHRALEMRESSAGDAGRPASHRLRGFLGRLARDKAGNTLALIAAFALPLCALAGAAVDTTRLYVVKVRLQQACDAGVLAGRKVMTVTSGTALDDTTKPGTPAWSAADAFFKNNFTEGWMGTTGRTFTASRLPDGQVTGRASVTAPMAIMGMFGASASTLTVTCTARLDIGDSDIMFVLDVTGSMACVTRSGCSETLTWDRADGTKGYYIKELPNSKISSLRAAVKQFRTTLETNKPAAAHIRYGFVPYSSSVNVGALIMAKSKDYIVDNAAYPSRELATNLSTATLPTNDNTANYSVKRGQYNQGDVNYGPDDTVSSTKVTLSTNKKEECLKKQTRKDLNGNDYPIGSWPTSGTLRRAYPVWLSNSCSLHTWTIKPLWRYKQVNQNVSLFKTSYGKGVAGVADPTKITGAKTKWQGCIEERGPTPRVPSTTSTTYDSDDLPADLDPDLVPTSDATRWRPLWPNVVYYRQGPAEATDSNGATSGSSDVTSTDPHVNYTNLLEKDTDGSLANDQQLYGCSAPAQGLAVMDAAKFDSYLGTATSGDFRAFGRTYHDVGMIWGLRLISPDGLWKSDTTAWPGNNPPNRYIVFMTDGNLEPEQHSYYLYGLNKVASGAAAAGTSNTTLATIHNARFQAVCRAAKDKNITVFVVAFDVGNTVPPSLQDCSTPGYAYAATDSTTLENAFKTIALQIARLRISE
jgi:Flp pilus assembly protein TadG